MTLSSRIFDPGGRDRSSKDAPVLYLHPLKQSVDFRALQEAGRPYGVIPVGIAGLINLLRQNGIEVKGLNCPLEKQLNPSFDLAHWLKGRRGVRVILIDLHWYEHSYGAIDLARVCKAALPWAWVVLGGLTASGFARQILQDFPQVDFIVRGDAEEPLLTLVSRLLKSGQQVDPEQLADIPNLSYRSMQGIVETPIGYVAAAEDLDRLDFVDLSFMEHAREYFVHEYIVTDLHKARAALETSPLLGKWITTARGCRYHCSYCGGSKESHKTLAGRIGLIPRSPARVVDDLARLAQAGVVQASLSYDIAEMGEAYWREIFTRMRSSGVRIGLYNELFQLPEPGFIRDLAATAHMPHSCVALSPLSGNERVRRLNGKHYNNDQLFDVLEVLNEHNFYIFVYFSLNLPGETEKTFDETLSLAHQIAEFYPVSLLKILNTVHTVDPFSPMSVSPEKFGIQVEWETFMDYYNYCRETQYAGPEARSGKKRGFRLAEADILRQEAMANRWDVARLEHENCWWPIPPSW